MDGAEVHRSFQRFWHVAPDPEPPLAVFDNGNGGGGGGGGSAAAVADVGGGVGPDMAEDRPGLGLGLNIAFNIVQAPARRPPAPPREAPLSLSFLSGSIAHDCRPHLKAIPCPFLAVTRL